MSTTRARSRIATFVSVLTVASLAASCTGGWIDISGSADRENRAPGVDGGTTSGTNPDRSPDAGNTSESPAARPPMRRLTKRQYRRAARDLLPLESLPEMQLPKDDEVRSIPANTSRKLQTSQARYYFDAAESLGEAAVGPFEELTGCSPEPDPACIDDFIGRFGRNAFRRPLTDSERERFRQFYRTQADRRNAKVAVELLVRAILQSPQFLYRPVHSEGELDGFELASRLSFTLWNSIPDDRLLDAAAAGELSTADGIEAQARRMLRDPRARDATVRFVMDWFGLSDLSELPDDTFDDQTKRAMRQQVHRFIETVLWEENGRLEDLFTADYTFVNAELAAIYENATAPDGEQFRRVSTRDNDQRGGILTLPAFLAAHSKGTPSVDLGAFIQQELLCNTVPAPPDELKNPPSLGPEASSREWANARMDHKQCGTCHDMLEGPGLAFDRFDRTGRLRSTDEHGNSLHNRTKMQFELGGPQTPVDGPEELSDLIAESEDFSRCAARTLQAAVEGIDPETAPSRDAAELRAIRSGVEGGFREQLIALVRSETFRSATP